MTPLAKPMARAGPSTRAAPAVKRLHTSLGEMPKMTARTIMKMMYMAVMLGKLQPRDTQP